MYISLCGHMFLFFLHIITLSSFRALIRKAVWNRYIGPGGGTRHLHQIFNTNGGEIGLTVYSKDICAVFGKIPPLSVQIK